MSRKNFTDCSRTAFCTCPTCLGTRVKDLPCEQDLYADTAARIKASDFGASKPVVVGTRFRPSLAEKWDCPKAPGGHVGGDFDPGYSAQRAAFLELLQKTRQEHDETQETILLRALGMTAEEAVANRHRISRQCHPDQDVFMVDGEPVVAIHKPLIRGDELVISYQILRTLP